jgi:hypothetical protein
LICILDAVRCVLRVHRKHLFGVIVPGAIHRSAEKGILTLAAGADRTSAAGCGSTGQVAPSAIARVGLGIYADPVAVGLALGAGNAILALAEAIRGTFHAVAAAVCEPTVTDAIARVGILMLICPALAGGANAMPVRALFG